MTQNNSWQQSDSPNPFQPAMAGGGGFDQGMAVKSRLSALAVSSLVFSLICCLPGTGAIATILGAGGLVRISQSQGRLSGKSLAIVGIVLGLLCTMAWVGVSIGIAGSWQMFAKPVDDFMVSAEKPDYDVARRVLTPEASKLADDATIKAFVDSYQAELGSFAGVPRNLIEAAKGYMGANLPPSVVSGMSAGNTAQAAMFPIPANFQNGQATVLLVMDPSQSAGGGLLGTVTNVRVITRSGREFILFVDATAPAAAPKSVNPASPAGLTDEEAAPVKKPGF